MKKDNKLMVIISIILTLVIASAIFAYLFFMTDMFKSNKELFAKYFVQNTETYKKIMKFHTIQVLEELGIENKYEANTTIKTVHSEGGEISNQMNDFSGQVNIQKNNNERYMYADAQIIYKDEECLKAELIKEQEQYGIKFPGISKKFVTIQKDEKLEVVADEIGIKEDDLVALMNIIDGNVDNILLQQKTIELKDKYLNIIKKTISNGVFKKQKDALITYNNETTKTNSYTVSLSSEQVSSLLIEILNNIKSETELFEKFETIIETEKIQNLIDETINNINNVLEIPTIEITVYENKQQTIRTVFEMGTDKIILENMEGNGQIKSKIQYKNSDETVQVDTEINKFNSNMKEQFEVIMDIVEGEENYTINISNEMNLIDNEINIKTDISHNQNITTTAIVLESKVIKGIDFDKKQSLEQGGYVLLNILEEATRKQFIAELKERMPQKIDNKIDIEVEEKKEEEPQEEQISQIEINKFNAKFEFYTGEEVSGENIIKLLEVVRNNIVGHVITDIEDENSTSSNKKAKKEITIYVDKDKTNEESMTKLIETVVKNKKYKVSISYKDLNGMIDYITITEK